MGADGSDPVRLIDNGADSYDPRWSPDGASILYTTAVAGSMDIWIAERRRHRRAPPDRPPGRRGVPHLLQRRPVHRVPVRPLRRPSAVADARGRVGGQRADRPGAHRLSELLAGGRRTGALRPVGRDRAARPDQARFAVVRRAAASASSATRMRTMRVIRATGIGSDAAKRSVPLPATWGATSAPKAAKTASLAGNRL